MKDVLSIHHSNVQMDHVKQLLDQNLIKKMVAYLSLNVKTILHIFVLMEIVLVHQIFVKYSHLVEMTNGFVLIKLVSRK